MKRFLILLNVLLFSSLLIAQEELSYKKRKEFIDYVVSTLSDNFENSHVAFKIRAYNSKDVYIYDTWLSELFSIFKEYKSWNEEKFFEYFIPIIFNDEVLIVDEVLIDIFFRYPNIKYDDCINLYNLKKDEFEYILLNTKIGELPVNNFDCFTYKSLKSNVLPTSVMITDGISIGLDMTLLYDNPYPKDKEFIYNIISEFKGNAEEYKKIMEYVLSKPYLYKGWSRYIAFKIQSYKSKETYLFYDDVYNLFRYFHNKKNWDEKKFKKLFLNLLINDEVLIVEEDMEHYFFENENLLLKNCEEFYNFNNQKDFYDFILNSDLKLNPIPNLSCFVYKGLKNYTFLGIEDSEYFILIYPFSM